MKSLPLRGRSEPLGKVLSLVRGVCRGGSASAVVVWGPGGIGKSALLSQACREADRLGARVVYASCDRVDQVSPGAPVVAALRAGRDPVAGAEEYERIVQARGEPLLMAERIASVLENVAAAGPLVVAVDDVQWADRVSRMALRMLMGRLIGLPVVWMFACRAEQSGLDLLGFEPLRVESVRLGPLAADDVTALAMDRLGRVPDARTRGLLQAAAGNPLLAVQILDVVSRAAERGSTDRMPLEFNAVIARRLSELEEDARQVVTVVAVAGRAIAWPDVVALLPPDPERGWDAVLAAVLDSGLVQASGDVLKPRHDLVCEAVCSAVPQAAVRAWHLRLAEHYLSVAGDALLAAAHVQRAVAIGDVTGAQVMISAAEQLAAVSPQDAGDLAAAAFRTLRPDQPQWLEVGRRSLAVLRATQRAGDTVAMADAILARIDDGDVVGAVEAEAAQALWVGGRLEELLARTRRVLHDPRLDPAVSARLHAVRALANSRLLPGPDAAREAGAALEGARAIGDADALAIALRAAGEAARNEGRHQKALECFRELRILTGPGCLPEEVVALQFLDRYDHAQKLLDEVRAGSGEMTRSVLPGLQCAQMWQDFNLGRHDEAETAAGTLLEIGRQLESGLYLLDAMVVQISVALLHGDTVTAAVRLETAQNLAGADEQLRDPGLAVMRGWLAAARGLTAAAAEELAPVVVGASQACGYWPLWPCWMGQFYLIGTANDDQRFAQLAIDVAELAAERNPGVVSFQGLAMSVRARSKGDLAMLRRSAELLGGSPRPLLRGFGAERLGRALVDDGDREAGLVWLDRAWDEYHAIGARAYRAAVQQAMRESGVKKDKWIGAAARPESGPGSLTDAEQRVALLIAAGHTNRSAAAELGVSANTVGTHLRQVFAKLGVQSRVQLVNAMRQESPAPAVAQQPHANT
jgi:DNA-binding CsgD family transcriptional regulator